jgi:hypothetical protein
MAAFKQKKTSSSYLHFENLPLINKSFSYSFASWLLAYFHEESFWENSTQFGLTRDGLKQQIGAACHQHEENLFKKQLKQWENRMKGDYEGIRKDKRLDELGEMVQSLKDKKQAISSSLSSLRDPIVVKIYSNYEAILQLPFLMGYFDKKSKRHYELQLTKNREEADFLFLTEQVKDFYSIPLQQRVNQFPYEGSLIRKVR